MPERLRVLGFVDTNLLWLNLGVSLLVLVLPAYFDLSLKDALAATVVGGLIGNSMLALAAVIGADARVPSMVLQRAPLGRRGSYVATILNVAQCMGWAIFELIVIATAAGLLCDKLFGFEATWAWKLVFGAAAACGRKALQHRRSRAGVLAAQLCVGAGFNPPVGGRCQCQPLNLERLSSPDLIRGPSGDLPAGNGGVG